MRIEDLIRRALEDEADDGRLSPGFASRVVAALPPRRPALRWRWPVVAASAAAMIVAVALVATQLPQRPRPTTSPNPTIASSPAVAASPSPTEVASVTASPSGATSSDGVPVSIDGVPVLRGSAITAQARSATDATSFLIGGRVARDSMACLDPAPPQPPLPPRCGALWVDGVPLSQDATRRWPQFIGVYLVLRVHVHDPQAAACDPAVRSLCEQAVVPEALVWVPPAGPGDQRADVVDALAGRYDDGLPRSIGGQPVHRGKEAIAFATSAHAGMSFLVGGWVTNSGALLSCPLYLDDSNWLRQCGRPDFSDTPGAPDGALMNALTLWFSSTTPGTGPVVVSVHVGDPRAIGCKPDPVVCARMMVAERTVWTGDSATDPRGLDAAAVAAALRSVDRTLTMTPIGPGVSPIDCSAPFPGAVGYVVSGAEGIGFDTVRPTVTYVGIAPTERARLRVVPLAPTTSDTLAPKASICTIVSGGSSNPHPGTYVQRWLVYDNVALTVSVHEVPTTADRAFLDALLMALAAADPLR